MNEGPASLAKRRAELLMSSFEPFSRDLPEDERNKARKDLLDTLLSDATLAHSKSDSNDGLALSSSQLNLIQQLFDLDRKWPFLRLGDWPGRPEPARA